MNRGQWIAVFVAVVAVAGLVAARATRDEVAAPSLGDQPADADADADEGSEEAADDTDATPPTTAALAEPPPVLGEAGDLRDLDGWLQTDATAFADFDGTVRVVQFWTFGCINCKNTLANLRALYDEYEPRGLEVIGVHTPEFEFEKDPERIAEAAVDLGVNWPIALDTDKTNFRAWQPGRRFWPRTFVVDTEGRIRFDRIGEGAYDELNATVAYLIENEA